MSHQQRRPFRVKGWIPLAAVPRVEVEQQPTGPVDTRTPTQKLADIYLAAHEKRQAEDRAEEQRKIDERQRRENEQRAKRLREQAEQDKANRRATFLMQESLIDSCLEKYSSSITPEEKDAVKQILLDTDFTAECCEIECLKILAKKQQVTRERITKLRDRCLGSEWQQIEDTLARHRHDFSDAEVASGEAHELIYRRLFIG
jgi:hypothetical protein